MKESKKIRINTNPYLHFIGLIFVNCKNMNNSIKSETQNLNHINVTNILVNNRNEFPTIWFKLTDDFKYKKYIREYLKSSMNLKKKYIIEIKYFNKYKKLHNYVVFIKEPKCIENGLTILNIPFSSNKFAWRPIIDFYKTTSNNLTNNKIYKIIYESYLHNNYKVTFIPDEVYQNSYILDYIDLLILISNTDVTFI
jgi:hypothetical protein